jgi:hypothetical protein
MPSIKSLLNEIRDELDSRQIAVKLHVTHEGIVIETDDYASKLIARQELRRYGFIEAAAPLQTKPSPTLCTSGTRPRS